LARQAFGNPGHHHRTGHDGRERVEYSPRAKSRVAATEAGEDQSEPEDDAHVPDRAPEWLPRSAHIVFKEAHRFSLMEALHGEGDLRHTLARLLAARLKLEPPEVYRSRRTRQNTRPRYAPSREIAILSPLTHIHVQPRA
jgi:hypothetical protein